MTNNARLHNLIRHPEINVFQRNFGFEYERRLLCSVGGKYFSWEGITWVLDLLPNHPGAALQALDAYLTAHVQHLTDEMAAGLQDAMAVIRARFIQCEQPIDALLNLEPYRFEEIIAVLYKRMGYVATRTAQSDDGGIDVVAEKSAPGHRIKLLIQCKRERANIGVKVVRELYGVLEDQKGPKAVILATSGFTRRATEFAAKNSRVDLVDKIALIQMMNEYLSPDWPKLIDRLRLREPIEEIHEGNHDTL